MESNILVECRSVAQSAQIVDSVTSQQQRQKVVVGFAARRATGSFLELRSQPNYGKDRLLLGERTPNCDFIAPAGPSRFRSLSRVNQLWNRLNGSGVPLRRQHLHQFAMAMDKMTVTEEEILEEKRHLDQDVTYLGKEASPVVEDVDESSPALGEVGAEMQECWDLWQRIGLPVQKIAKQRHMTETGVLLCILMCVQDNYTVDWYELCKEAQFTSDIARRMIQSTEKYVSEAKQRKGAQADIRILRRYMPDNISHVHFVLYLTMLKRGLPYQTIMDISVQTDKEEADGGAVYATIRQFPTDVTESALLKFFSEKDRVSLVEIALKFRGCDDLELMRLILKLEEQGRIFLRDGFFRIR